MALGSKSYFFLQDEMSLLDYRNRLESLLHIKDFNNDFILFVLQAYDWFSILENNKMYDGATLTQDLYDVGKLDSKALLHDWLYIYLSAYSSKKALRIADDIYIKTLKKFHVFGVYVSWQKFRLFILREILNYAWISRVFRDKEPVNDNQLKLLNDVYKTIK